MMGPFPQSAQGVKIAPTTRLAGQTSCSFNQYYFIDQRLSSPDRTGGTVVL
jgi:hypothetical protein